MEDRRDVPSFQVVGHDAPLEYATPESPRRRPVADWSMVLALAFFCGMLHFIGAVIVPIYEGHYRNLGTKLPTVTLGILRFSRFIVNDYGWLCIWPFALVIPVATSALRRAPPRDERGFGLGFVLVLIATSFALMVSLIALAAPFITIGQRVMGGGQRP